MRVVIDTNVFISAGLKHGSPPSNAVHLAVKHDLLLKSEATEQELFITLARPRLAVLIPSLFQDWLRDVLDSAELVSISERIAACRDPKDDKFLEVAVSGRADLIVSGDADLLAINPFRGIPIVTPAAFLEGRRRQSR